MTITDAHLSDINVVDRYDYKELQNAADLRYVVARHLGDLNLAKDKSLDHLKSKHSRWHEQLIKANFTSRINLSQFSHQDLVRPEIFFCGDPDKHIIFGLPYIYRDGQEIESNVFKVSPFNSPSTLPPITYYIFFRISQKASPESIPPTESFDLKTNPQDICFKIVGGKYRSMGFESNTVVITREALNKVLRE